MAKNKAIKIIIPIVLILLLFLVILLFISVKGINLDFSSYGHGDYSRGGFGSLFSSLGIGEDYDVDLDGGMCLNDDCWTEVEVLYASCCEDFEVVEFGIGIFNIGEGFFGDVCPEECEEEYVNNLRECQIPCEEEIYVWDGTPIGNLNNFFEYNFPVFYESSKNKCEGWLLSGNWISESNMVGCSDFRFYTDSTCSRESIASAGRVCETIGKTFICNEDKITCEG